MNTTRRGFFRLLGCGLLIPVAPTIFLPPRGGWCPARWVRWRPGHYGADYGAALDQAAYSIARVTSVELAEPPLLGNDDSPGAALYYKIW